MRVKNICVIDLDGVMDRRGEFLLLYYGVEVVGWCLCFKISFDVEERG